MMNGMMHQQHNVEHFIQQLVGYQGWGWNYGDGEFLVEVPTMAGRTQVVHITVGNDPEGLPMLFIWSPVAELHMIRQEAEAFLQYNAELSYGAAAIFQNMLVIKETQLMNTADPEEVSRMVFHVARVADELEAQNLGHHVDMA